MFVHANELLDDKSMFTPGMAVEFEVTEGERGLKAFAVKAVGRPSAEVAAAPSPAKASTTLDDVLCDVLSRAEYSEEVTETLVSGVPTLTGQQIIQIREHLLRVAHKHGWTED